jgi:hypothetical protein
LNRNPIVGETARFHKKSISSFGRFPSMKYPGDEVSGEPPIGFAWGHEMAAGKRQLDQQ